MALLGIITCLPVYLVIYHLQARGQSAAALAMGSMHMNQMGVFWSFPLLQAAGIGALIWSYLGIVLGLVVAGRPPRWWRLSRPSTDQLHRQVSLLVIALILVHAFATAEDAMGDNLRTAFVPWQESWTAAVFAYNIGIFALYLAVLVGPTYYLRRRIGTRWWRIAHRLAVLVYILGVWHTLLLGTDFSHYSWLRAVTWLAQIPLLSLLAYRLVRTRRRGPVLPGSSRYWAAPARYWLAAVSAAAAVAVAVLVGTGHANLPARVGTASPHPSGPADLVPGWLGVALALLLAVVALYHVRHIVTGPGGRIWHGAHVLMAAGMADMLLPLKTMPVPATAGEITFGAAALAAAGIGAARWRAARPGAIVALVTGADLAIMVYMFAVTGSGSIWLTYLLCAWLTLETAYWASGRLAVLAGHAAYSGGGVIGAASAAFGDVESAGVESVSAEPVDESAPAGPATGVLVRRPERASAVQPETRPRIHRHTALAVSLTLMCLCMAYMLLAMHYSADATPGNPGMGGMPGM